MAKVAGRRPEKVLNPNFAAPDREEVGHGGDAGEERILKLRPGTPARFQFRSQIRACRGILCNNGRLRYCLRDAVDSMLACARLTWIASFHYNRWLSCDGSAALPDLALGSGDGRANFVDDFTSFESADVPGTHPALAGILGGARMCIAAAL